MSYKKSILCISLSALTLFAQTNSTQDPNPSDRFGTSKSSNAYFIGEAVWFKPLNEEFASIDYTINSGSKTLSESYLHNEFQLGLRLTFGVNTNYDGWDTLVSYTALRYSQSQGGYVNIYDSTSSLFIDQNITRKLSYQVNLVDFDLGRMFKVSEKLSLRPHVGVRSFWLIQKDSLQIPQNDPLKIQNKFSSTLVGMEGGFDTFWKFSKGFSLYANIAVATLVDMQKRSVNSSIPPPLALNTDHATKMVPALDYSLGLRWDITFNSGQYHFAFNAGYEHHSYYNLNNNNIFSQALNSEMEFNLLQSSDFCLQGIALGARFDF